MIAIIKRVDGVVHELYQMRNNEKERIIVKTSETRPKGTRFLEVNHDFEEEEIELDEQELSPLSFNSSDSNDILDEYEELEESGNDDTIEQFLTSRLKDNLYDLEEVNEEEDNATGAKLVEEWRGINSDKPIITDKYGRKISSTKESPTDEDNDDDTYDDEEDEQVSEHVKSSGKLMEAISGFVNILNYEVTPQGTMVNLKNKVRGEEYKDEDGKIINYDFSRRTVKTIEDVYLKCIETGQIVKVKIDGGANIKDCPTLPNGTLMTFERPDNNKKAFVLYTKDGKKMLKPVEVKRLKTPLPEDLEKFYKLNKKGEHIINSTILQKKLNEEPYKSTFDSRIGVLDENERRLEFKELLKKTLEEHQIKVTEEQEVTSEAVSVKLREKLEYGDRQLAQDLSVKVNEVVNFSRESSELLEKNIDNRNGRPVTLSAYKTNKRKIFYEVMSISGELLSRKFIDEIGVVLEVFYNDNFDKAINKDIHYDRIYTLVEKGGKASNFNLSHLKVAHLPSIKYFRTFLNMKYLDRMDAQILDTPNKLYDMADEINKLPMDHIIGYDAETSGLNFYKQIAPEDRDVLATHSLSWKDWQSVIIPVRMKHSKNIPMELINEVLKPILEKRKILAHNGQADVRFNIPDGIDLNLEEDSMILIKHLVPFVNKPSGIGFKKDLEGLVRAWKGYDMIDLNKYVFKPAGISFDFTILNEDYMIAYGCPDTMLMRMMYKDLIKKLGKVQEPAYREHVKFAKNLAKFSTYPGIGVDVAAIEQEKEEALYVVEKIEKEIYRISNKTPETFNISSSQQKRNVLYAYFGCPTEEMIRTEKGELPVDKNALKKLAKLENKIPSNMFEEDIVDTDGEIIASKEELNKMRYPITKLLLIHSDLNKNISSYYNGMLNNTINNVYNPQYKDGYTDTWRTTDRLQITKSSMKYNMCTYGPDYGFADADFAAEEFRLAVNLSGDPSLIEMLQNPENDAHTGTAAKVFNVEPQYVVKAQRDAGKTCNFGIIYGMGPKTLAKRIAGKDIINNEELEWGTLCYNKYAAANKPIMKMIENNRKFVADNGFFVNQLGAKMVYPQVIDIEDYKKKLFDDNPDNLDNIMHPMGYGIIPKFCPEKRAENRGALLTISGNYPIQSWAAVILMVVYNRLCDIIIREGYYGEITVPLTVHDEIGVIYNKKLISPFKIMAMMKEALEYEFNMAYETTKLFIGIGFGNSWGQCKADIREVPNALQDRLVQAYNNGTAPTLEDMGDDHGTSMQRILENYMMERAYLMFKDMADNRHFIVSEMTEITNIEMYVPKKLAETFAIKTSRFDGLKFVEERICSDGKVRKVPKVSSYRKVIAEFLKVPEEEFTFEDGEFTDKQVQDTSHLKDFLITNKVHEIVLIGARYVDITVASLDRLTRKKLDAYLRQFEVPEGEGKKVRYSVGPITKFADFELQGLPESAGDDIQHLINTGEVIIHERKPNIGELPFSVDVDRKTFVINAYSLVNHYSKEKYHEFITEISKYQGDEYAIEFNNGKETTTLNWGLNSISDKMVDNLLRVIRS